MGKLECNWVNTTLMRFEDPYDNHIEFNDGETLHKLNVLDADWEKLCELHFPWEYWPDMSRFEESDLIQVAFGEESYEFRPRNTKLMLFADERANHVEHQPNPSVTRGMTVVPALWRMMFKGDYPIKFLPYIDLATREYFKNIGRPLE
jgi:hypothetical protein